MEYHKYRIVPLSTYVASLHTYRNQSGISIAMEIWQFTPELLVRMQKIDLSQCVGSVFKSWIKLNFSHVCFHLCLTEERHNSVLTP